MIQEHAIRQKLTSVLLEGMSLNEFERWLTEQSWNMHLDSSRAAQRLCSDVELALAEHSNGHSSEAELWGELWSILDHGDVSLILGDNMPISRRQPSVVTAANSYQVGSLKPVEVRFAL